MNNTLIRRGYGKRPALLFIVVTAVIMGLLAPNVGAAVSCSKAKAVTRHVLRWTAMAMDGELRQRNCIRTERGRRLDIRIVGPGEDLRARVWVWLRGEYWLFRMRLKSKKR